VPATFKVEITPTAERDIEEIWDYIAQDGPENATAFILALEIPLSAFHSAVR
jgi:plasmid stabilization system protein ParE